MKVLETPDEVPSQHDNLFSSMDRIFIKHPAFVQVQKKIEYILSLHGAADSMPCIPYVGPTGVGKTTIFRKLRDKYPVRPNARKLLLAGGETLTADYVPVLFVRMHSKPNAIALLRRILRALAAPHAEKGKREDLEERVNLYLEACGTKLVVIDEGQRLVDKTGAITAEDVVDCIKDIHEVAGVGFVVFALPRIRSLFSEDAQVNRRWNEYSIKPYSWGSLADEVGTKSRMNFIGLLVAFHRETPLPFSPDLDMTDDEIALRFFYASAGVIGRLKDLLKGAMTIASESDETIEFIDLNLLSRAFRQIFQKEIRENKYQDPFSEKWTPGLPPFLPDDDVSTNRRKVRSRKKDRDMMVRFALTKA
jgi:hypothetical protein